MSIPASSKLLDDFETQIASLSGELGRKTLELEAEKKKLSEIELELSQKTESLSESHHKISVLTGNLAERDSQLTQQALVIKEKSAEIEIFRENTLVVNESTQNSTTSTVTKTFITVDKCNEETLRNE